MWIQVRSMDGKQNYTIKDLERLTSIENLREKLVEYFQVPAKRQRLFFRGKQLVDGHSLFDYKVGLNDVVQLMIMPEIDETVTKTESSCSGYESCGTGSEDGSNGDREEKEEEWDKSLHYKIGDCVDARDVQSMGWYEAKIVKIGKICYGPVKEKEDEYWYYVLFDGYEEDAPTRVSFENIRPRAYRNIKKTEVKVGDTIMANYNAEDPDERGYWFDAEVTKAEKDLIEATVLIGHSAISFENCQLKFLDELFIIESAIPLDQRDRFLAKRMKSDLPPKRLCKPNCSHCKDNPRRKCKMCACSQCGGKDKPGDQIICDECNSAYHIWCLTPELKEIPQAEEWYCPSCKNDADEVIKAGEKLKASKKRASMPSALNPNNKNWGKGMACMGRSKTCSIVGPDHFGPIPNVPVGSMWKFRVQVSESGVHRPPVGGIAGRSESGAVSIVLSGGYEDDKDDGDEFTYTGSGGRDLSGNKRTAQQSSDQTLTKCNKAIALNCDAPLNKAGAEAKNWKNGKPVRVVRNYKGRKHSKYCPEDGNRYDGIYKVVKYWPEKGRSGFLVWRYMFRRDDPTPAPWTKAGKKLIAELRLTMEYPEGYLEQQELEKKSDSKNTNEKKRSLEPSSNEPAKKKPHSEATLPPHIKKLIEDDNVNKKIWSECLDSLKEGKMVFLKTVEELFTCICCQDPVYKPVTTPCQHNICKGCLNRSFKARVYTCPACRYELGTAFDLNINEKLKEILEELLAGYEKGR